jgi:hypothetical protein
MTLTVQRHLVGFQYDPVTRSHVGRQGTRVPIQIVAAQFSSVFLFDHGNRRFGNNFMRHAHHDAVGDLLVQGADMRPTSPGYIWYPSDLITHLSRPVRCRPAAQSVYRTTKFGNNRI